MQFTTSIITILLVTLLAISASAQDDGPGFVTQCNTPGLVALTFDDGPSPFTPDLLETLAKEKIPATFFVLGKSINEGDGKQVLKAAFDAGHQIALHSNTHADMNALTADEIQSEFEINLKAVVDTIGVEPAMARPPFGNCDEECAGVMQKLGLTVIQWNCDSNDWQYDTNPKLQIQTFTNVETIITPSNPKDDSFVTLQHDIKDYSVALTGKIIDLIKGKGYKFVTVEECLGKTIPAYKGQGKAPPTKAPEDPVVDPAADPATDPATDPAADPYEPKTAQPPTPEPESKPQPQPESEPEPEPQPSKTPNKSKFNDAVFPSEPPSTSANSEDSASQVSSADKLTSTFGLILVGLISGLLMY